jgi:exodeoxyribonuclease-3
MRIATWNINSINQRVENLVAWLKARAPDVVCLQEIKCQTPAFPREPFEALGYGHMAVHGQKTFNGVALLSKLPLEDVTPGLPGDDSDEQARFVAATAIAPAGAVRIGCIYLPNGNPVDTEKYPYKLKWMDRLAHYAREQMRMEEPLVLAGDYNVIPAEADVHNPELWRGDALFLPQTRAKFRSLASLGLTDAIRALRADPGLYTFWDYQAGAWQKNNGIRIDHLMLSPPAADLLSGGGIDKHVRAWEKPSDHVPVWIDLDLPAA